MACNRWFDQCVLDDRISQSPPLNTQLSSARESAPNARYNNPAGAWPARLAAPRRASLSLTEYGRDLGPEFTHAADDAVRDAHGLVEDEPMASPAEQFQR